MYHIESCHAHLTPEITYTLEHIYMCVCVMVFLVCSASELVIKALHLRFYTFNFK